MLTRRQHDLLTFVHQRLSTAGIAPSYDEMMVALNLRSRSGIHRILKALEERGFIRRLPYRERAIEVLKRPADTRIEPARADPLAGSVLVDYCGEISVSTALGALALRNSPLSIPRGLLPEQGSFFAVDAKTDAMIGAGISPGDRLVFVRIDTPLNGDIVLAVLDEEDVLFGRYRRVASGLSALIERANEEYEPRIFGSVRLRTMGRLVTLLRNYQPDEQAKASSWNV